MTSSLRLGRSSSLIAPLLVAGLAVFLMVVIFGIAGPAAANDQATLSLIAPEGSIPVGTEISVTVHISDVVDLWALGLTLEFPPDMLQVVDADTQKAGIQVIPGDCPNPVSPQGFLYYQVDNSTGTINYVVTQLYPTSPVTGDCDVFHVHFLTTSGPEALLHFSYVLLSDIEGAEIPVTVIDRQLSLGMEIYLPMIVKK